MKHFEEATNFTTDKRTGNSETGLRDIHKMNFYKKPRLPIDRGWAWFVMIGAYVIVLVANTLGRSLSIFLPDILELYNEPATVTTLAFGIGDIAWSLTNIAMPSLLLPRFGVRTLALWGASFHCFAVIALAYSPNIIFFNCLFGVFGSADGLMIVTSMIHLGHYFKKRLSFASAVVQIGGSTAMILAPRMAQFLKDTYGYQGALLVLGGISFHCVTAAMLLWPVSMFDDNYDSKVLLNSRSKNNIQEFEDFHDMAIIIKAQEEDASNEISTFLDVKEFKTNQITELNTTSDFTLSKYVDILKGHLQSEGKESIEVIPLSSGKSIPRSIPQNIQNKLQLSSSLSELELDTIVSDQSGNCSQNEYFISYPNDVVEPDNGANREAHELYAKCEPSEGYVLNSLMEENVCNQTALIQDGSESLMESTQVTSGKCCSLQKIKAYLLSSVLVNPVAMMLIVTGMFSTSGGNMYLPVLALENGLTPEKVPWMLTITGIGDIFGKLVIGYFADLGCVRPIRIVCISQLTFGMVCQFTTFYKGFGPMAGMAVIFGMMNGVVQSLLATLVVEFLGLSYLAQVTSIFCVACGVSTFIINVAFGAIKDATGSFSGGFNLLGGMALANCVILSLEPLFLRCRDKISQHAKNSHASGIN